MYIYSKSSGGSSGADKEEKPKFISEELLFLRGKNMEKTVNKTSFFLSVNVTLFFRSLSTGFPQGKRG